MRMYLKPVLSGLLLMFAMSAMAQGTNEYLQPCDKPLPTYKMVWSGNMLEDPEGFQKQMEEMMKSPRNYDVVCGTQKLNRLLKRAMKSNVSATASLWSAAWN